MKVFSSSVGKILLIVFFMGITTIGFLGYRKISSERLILNNVASVPIKPSPVQPEPKPGLILSGWLPYWSATEGMDSLKGNETLFDEIRPFAIDIANDGSFVDKLGLNSEARKNFFVQEKSLGRAVYPTLLWTDAPSMHKIFADPELRQTHIGRIVTFLVDHDFPGVDIDYEGKDVADRDAFSAFLEELKGELAPLEKKLSCTVEARTDDTPPAGWTGIQSMSYANDFKVLGRVCDTVSLMAYDEVFQIHRANTFETPDEIPNAPQADRRWAESVIQYALRSIAPEKIMLGIPTYGWEFEVVPTKTGYRYTRIKSVSYPEAMTRASEAHVSPKRTEGGEPSLLLRMGDGQRLITFSDVTSIKEKIDLAKQYHLRGVIFFKLDGLSDPALFPLLQKEKE